MNPTFRAEGVDVKLRFWKLHEAGLTADCVGCPRSRIDGVCQWGRVSCLWAPCPLDAPGLRSLLHAKQTCAVRCSRRRERRRGRRGRRADVRREKSRAKRVEEGSEEEKSAGGVRWWSYYNRLFSHTLNVKHKNAENT
ncbi:hypothetical protein AMECASPLE_021512 [Ameca splendens]|uniref:Uncharacterized protein n=1 Tax=Ameca splendens TaxID=208324 RepID=A0ABV0XGQ4_9TELE